MGVFRLSLCCALIVLFVPGTGCRPTVQEPDEKPAKSTAAPRIECAAPAHDFGTVVEGQTVHHVFPIRNSGAAPLIIGNIRAPAGCSVEVLPQKEIAPGSSADVKVTFNTSGRRGNLDKAITLESNDPKSPALSLSIRIDVDPLLGFAPSTLHIESRFGSSRTVEVALQGTWAPDAKLGIASVTGDLLSAEPLGKTPPSDRRGVRVTLDAKRIGEGAGNVVVSTGVAPIPEIVLPVSWLVRGNVEVRPSTLVFDPETPPGLVRILRVSSSKADFRIDAALASTSVFDATVVKLGSPGAFEVRVSLRGAEAAGQSPTGNLTLKTNDPWQKSIVVPLRTEGEVPAARPGMFQVHGGR